MAGGDEAVTTISQRVELQIGARDAGAQKSLKSVELGAKAAEKAANTLRAALAAGVGFLAAKFTVSSVLSIGKLADQTSKLARTVGASTESISRLRYVFDSIGIGADKLESVLNSFERKRAAALRGSMEAQRGFELLGISLEDLGTLGVEDLFERIALNLEQVGDQMERQARLSVAFADSFRDVEQMLGRGSAGFRQLRDDAQKFGLIISSDQGIAGEKFARAMRELEGVVERVFGGLLLDSLPWVTSKLEDVAGVLRTIAEWLGIIEDRSVEGLRRALVMAERELAIAQTPRRAVSGVLGIPTGPAEPVDAERVRRLQAEYNRLRALLVDVEQKQSNIGNAPGGGLTGLPGGPPPGSGPQIIPNTRGPGVLASLQDNSRFAPPTVGTPELQGPPVDWEQVRRNLQQQATFVDGLSSSWESLVQTMGTAAAVGQQFGNVVGNAIVGVTDTLIDMIETGKSSSEQWKQLGATILKQLAQVALNYAIIGGIKTAFGINFAHGGVGGGRGKDEPFRIHQFAHGGMAGGVAGGRSIAIYGETSRREAFVPLQDGRSIPVRIEGASGGGTQVNYYISAIDTQSMVQALSRHGAIYRGAVRDGLASSGSDRRAAKRAVR